MSKVNTKTKSVDRAVMKAKAKIKLRREQLAFDKLPKEEQEKRRRLGFDPYEPEHIREKKRRAEVERRKKCFDELPKDTRDALTALGLSPYLEDGQVIRRFGGSFSIK